MLCIYFEVMLAVQVKMLSFAHGIWFHVLLQCLPTFASNATCRYANNYEANDLLHDDIARTQFLDDYIFWENEFMKSGIAFGAATGMTYDGAHLSLTTGTLNANRKWSAASKEALHLMALCHQMNGSKFMDIDTEISILNTKLATYSSFNTKYPGFGGFIPWYEFDADSIIPSDSNHWLPALDNGQMYWALYALKWCIKSNVQSINNSLNINETLNAIDDQLTLMESNVDTVFHGGNGLIRWNSYISNGSLAVDDAEQSYTGGAWGTDAYEVSTLMMLEMCGHARYL